MLFSRKNHAEPAAAEVLPLPRKYRLSTAPAAHTLPWCQAEVFEEIATMEFPFEGIPTVPPRKDMDHMVRK